ncbi:molybdate ABC transporter substrate-binding protein [Aneurinibacillus terranovensis]|uniref:molybdate ABC transporter substrate-binding protein n=1 Tax=Aneurinibacillus terranovensis TaxID=278991 RepID=UPI0003FD6F65|nr:molybdate ABC transporter substrate-binding protein [Aneurinibacillus terranovensis]
MKGKVLSFLVPFSLVILALTGCTSGEKSASPASSSASATEKPKITVAAAANLKSAFKEIAANFENKTGSKVELTFGASGTLEQQIENGAPFDVFASANVKFVDKLVSEDKAFSDTEKLYAKGRVGLATSKKSTIQVKTLQDLLKPEVKKIALAKPEAAPYGAAAKQALEKAGLWSQAEKKIVYAKTIEDALTLVTSGNTEAGFVALAIVKDDEVNFSLIDEKLHKPLNQAIAVVKATKQESLARQFVDYVTSPEGQEIMKKYKFEIPTGKKK